MSDDVNTADRIECAGQPEPGRHANCGVFFDVINEWAADAYLTYFQVPATSSPQCQGKRYCKEGVTSIGVGIGEVI